MLVQTHRPRCECGGQRVTGVNFSFHQVGPRDQTQAIMLGGKHPHQRKSSCHSHPNFQLSFSVKVPCLYVRNNLKTHNSFEKPHMEILSSKHLTSFKTQKKQTGLFFSQASITVFTICKTLLKHRFCLLLFLAFIYIPLISKHMEGS